MTINSILEALEACNSFFFYRYSSRIGKRFCKTDSIDIFVDDFKNDKRQVIRVKFQSDTTIEIANLSGFDKKNDCWSSLDNEIRFKIDSKRGQKKVLEFVQFVFESNPREYAASKTRFSYYRNPINGANVI